MGNVESILKRAPYVAGRARACTRKHHSSRARASDVLLHPTPRPAPTENTSHARPRTRRYIDGLIFENIDTATAKLDIEPLNGAPFMPGNNFLPIVSNVHFVNAAKQCSFDCADMNRSQCFNLTVSGRPDCVPPPSASDPPPRQTYGCKKSAMTLFGPVTFPWAVCVPLDAPVNMFPSFPNYGPTKGNFATLAECQTGCSVSLHDAPAHTRSM